MLFSADTKRSGLNPKGTGELLNWMVIKLMVTHMQRAHNSRIRSMIAAAFCGTGDRTPARFQCHWRSSGLFCIFNFVRSVDRIWHGVPGVYIPPAK